jgi:hypothetical protein
MLNTDHVYGVIAMHESNISHNLPVVQGDDPTDAWFHGTA